MKLKLMKLIFFKMTVLIVKDFVEKYNLKNDSMNESKLQKVISHPIYPRVSKIKADNVFVYTNLGSQRGTNWTCLIMRNSISFCFDSFGEHSDTFQLNQIPKSMIYHVNKEAVMKSRLCGSCFLFFFYLIARMNCYDAILKMYLD